MDDTSEFYLDTGQRYRSAENLDEFQEQLTWFRWGDWSKDALCLGIPNPHIFFPKTRRQLKWAQAYCQLCPVSEQCAEEADRLYEATPPWFKDTERDLANRPIGVRAGRDLSGIPSTPLWFPNKSKSRPPQKSPKYTKHPIRKTDCEWCGKTFVTQKGPVKMWHDGLFCSEECYQSSQNFVIPTKKGDYRMCADCYQTFPTTKLRRTTPIKEHGNGAKRPSGNRRDGWYCRPCSQAYDRERRKKIVAKNRARILAKYTNPQTGKVEKTCAECGNQFRPKTLFAIKCKPCVRKIMAQSQRKNEYTHICAGCGKKQVVDTERASRLKHCSPECAYKYRGAKNRDRAATTIVCRYCNKTLVLPRSRAKNGRKYCSRECTNKHQRENGKPRHNITPPTERSCANRKCGQRFTPKRIRPGNPNSGLYCSKPCKTEDHKWRPYPTVKPCEMCGADMEVTMWLTPYGRLSPDQPTDEPADRPGYPIPKYCPDPCRRLANGNYRRPDTGQ